MMEIFPMIEFILLGTALFSTVAAASFLHQRQPAFLPVRPTVPAVREDN